MACDNQELEGLLGMEVSVIVLSSWSNEIWTEGTLFQKVNGQWLKRAVSKQNQFEMPEGMQLQ